MDRNLTLEAVRLTEAAALYASRYMGKGIEDLSYLHASEAMLKVFTTMDIDGEVVIGTGPNAEGSLSDGSKVGNSIGPKVELAVKPLDGKKTCAKGGLNAISIIAVGDVGSFFKTPVLYMEKIAVGKAAKGVVDINQKVDINIKRVARAKGKYIDDITVCVLDRDRNARIIDEIRKTGAKIRFITDGDISGAISTAFEDKAVDMLMGIGGAKEGVLAAAALKCLDGDIQARFVHYNREEKKKIEEITAGNTDMIYGIGDLVKGNDVMVAITGITDGVLLPGVRYFSGGAETNSIVLRQKTHTLRFIKAVHQFDYKPIF